jgi:hypothetical protein
MSSIPNSAMPHAGPAEETEVESPSLVRRAADLVRDNPKTAIAAGAAVVAGAAAAAAIPLVKARRAKSASSGSSGKSRSSAKKKSG